MDFKYGWFEIKCPANHQEQFGLDFNLGIGKVYEGYFKIFWPKKKSEKDGTFYLATDNLKIVAYLSQKYIVKECLAPDRSKISRFGGFTIERDWMFES